MGLFYISEGALLITSAKLIGVPASGKLNADVGPFGAIIFVLGLFAILVSSWRVDQKAVGLAIRHHDFCFGNIVKHHRVFLRIKHFPSWV